MSYHCGFCGVSGKVETCSCSNKNIYLGLARSDYNECNDMEERIQHQKVTGSNGYQDARRQQHQQDHRLNTHWQRPPTTWIKYNYDGSFKDTTTNGKIGWIIRNDNGDFCGAGQIHGVYVKNAFESELQALLVAMKHCWSQGYQKIIFEGDSQQVVQAIVTQTLHFNAYNWIRDIRWWMRQFEEVKLNWIPRIANKAADILAKSSIPNGSNSHCYRFVPNNILSVFIDDSVRS
ncbi:unnamed protein product, partial [Thlaspi arvense]